MKRKKLLYVGLLMALTIGITGCGGQIPDMTDAERAAISEYAANLLLKYDKNNTSRLVDLEDLVEAPVATTKPQVTQSPEESGGMDETVDTPVINPGEESSIKTEPKMVLGLPEVISIQYSDYEIMDSYTDPLDNDFMIEASGSNKLLVCNFVLINDGADKQSVDMLKDSITYVMQVDDRNVQCEITMLSNDLTTYLGILDADESRKVVVIAEYEESKLTESESIKLKIRKDEESAVIQIK